jgi:hypothetical protein
MGQSRLGRVLPEAVQIITASLCESEWSLQQLIIPISFDHLNMTADDVSQQRVPNGSRLAHI